MKRNVLVGMLLIAGFMIVINKLYYPPSPVNILSGKEILQKLQHSNERVVMIAKEDKNIGILQEITTTVWKKLTKKLKKCLNQKDGLTRIKMEVACFLKKTVTE